MPNPMLGFFKRTYKVLLVIVAAVVFFLGYNTYLVDHSLSNLRIALDQVNDVKTLEDAKKLASVLDYSLLNEVSSPELQPATLSKIEMAKDILSKPESMKQLEDVKYAIKEIVSQKEKKRSPVLVALDKINKVFAPTAVKVSKARLEDQAQYLKEKLNTAKDKFELQEIYYSMANVYTQLSKFKEAREAYLKVLELDPETKLAKKAKFNLAWNEKYQGNYDEAIKEFEGLSEIAGEEKLATFSMYQMAETYKKKGDFKKAVEIYQKISAKSNDNEMSQIANYQAGNTYLYDLKDIEKAKEVFDKSKGIGGDSSMQRHVEATALSSVANEYRKEGFLLLMQGFSLSLPQKYKEALDFFAKAIEIDPQDGVSYTGRALAYLWLKDPDRAMDAARKAVKILPNDETASINLGYIYIQLNLVDESIVEYKRFIAVNPFTARGYYNLGYAYILVGKLEEASAAFQQATRIDRKFSVAFNNEGWCFWQLGQYSQAVDAFERAIQIDPNFLDALFNLAMVYKSIGRLAEAKDKFDIVEKLDPGYPNLKQYLKEVNDLLQQ